MWYNQNQGRYHRTFEYAKCECCGRPFKRKTTEHWKKLCLACFRSEDRKARAEFYRRSEESRPRFNVYNLSDVARGEWLKENLKPLLGLVHPDKHGGSQSATRITQDLLKFKEGP